MQKIKEPRPTSRGQQAGLFNILDDTFNDTTSSPPEPAMKEDNSKVTLELKQAKRQSVQVIRRKKGCGVPADDPESGRPLCGERAWVRKPVLCLRVFDLTRRLTPQTFPPGEVYMPAARAWCNRTFLDTRHECLSRGRGHRGLRPRGEVIKT